MRKSPTLAEEPVRPDIPLVGANLIGSAFAKGRVGTSVTFGIAFDPPRILRPPALEL